jgi:hypothetical protein
LDSFFELTAKRRLKVQIESDFIWLDEDQVQLFAREKQKVSEPEGTAHKFTVGDYVVFIDGSNVPGALTWLSGMKKYVGKRDRIQYMGSEGCTCKLEHIPFWLNLEWIKPAELKLSPKRTIVIEITDDGAEAKYIVGKNIEKTASVKRYKDDKPDDQLAAHYVIGKLFGKKVMKDNVDMDALKNAKCDCMIARYHLDEISKVLDPFGKLDFGKVDFKF